jgi:hypothetical protein
MIEATPTTPRTEFCRELFFGHGCSTRELEATVVDVSGLAKFLRIDTAVYLSLPAWKALLGPKVPLEARIACLERMLEPSHWMSYFCCCSCGTTSGISFGRVDDAGEVVAQAVMRVRLPEHALLITLPNEIPHVPRCLRP